MNIKAKNFVTAYYKLARRLNYPHLFQNEDIKVNSLSDTYEILNVSIECDCNNFNRVNTNKCKFSDKYYLIENLWYAFGNNNGKFVAKYATMWYQMMDEYCHVRSNYGDTIRQMYGFNQLHSVVDILKEDPETRRAVIYLSNTVCTYKSKNVLPDMPCTNTLQFFIRNNKLHLMVNMRSNDIIYGLRYDAPFFMMLQQIVAHELEIEVGKYYHTSNSMHIYKKDIFKLDSLCDKNNYDNCISPDLSSLWTCPETSLFYDAISINDAKIESPEVGAFISLINLMSEKFNDSEEKLFDVLEPKI